MKRVPSTTIIYFIGALMIKIHVDRGAHIQDYYLNGQYVGFYRSNSTTYLMALMHQYRSFDTYKTKDFLHASLWKLIKLL